MPCLYVFVIVIAIVIVIVIVTAIDSLRPYTIDLGFCCFPFPSFSFPLSSHTLSLLLFAFSLCFLSLSFSPLPFLLPLPPNHLLSSSFATGDRLNFARQLRRCVALSGVLGAGGLVLGPGGQMLSLVVQGSRCRAARRDFLHSLQETQLRRRRIPPPLRSLRRGVPHGLPVPPPSEGASRRLVLPAVLERRNGRHRRRRRRRRRRSEDRGSSEDGQEESGQRQRQGGGERVREQQSKAET